MAELISVSLDVKNNLQYSDIHGNIISGRITMAYQYTYSSAGFPNNIKYAIRNDLASFNRDFLQNSFQIEIVKTKQAEHFLCPETTLFIFLLLYRNIYDRSKHIGSDTNKVKKFSPSSYYAGKAEFITFLENKFAYNHSNLHELIGNYHLSEQNPINEIFNVDTFFMYKKLDLLDAYYLDLCEDENSILFQSFFSSFNNIKTNELQKIFKDEIFKNKVFLIYGLNSYYPDFLQLILVDALFSLIEQCDVNIFDVSSFKVKLSKLIESFINKSDKAPYKYPCSSYDTLISCLIIYTLQELFTCKAMNDTYLNYEGALDYFIYLVKVASNGFFLDKKDLKYLFHFLYPLSKEDFDRNTLLKYLSMPFAYETMSQHLKKPFNLIDINSFYFRIRLKYKMDYESPNLSNLQKYFFYEYIHQLNIPREDSTVFNKIYNRIRNHLGLFKSGDNSIYYASRLIIDHYSDAMEKNPYDTNIDIVKPDILKALKSNPFFNYYYGNVKINNITAYAPCDQNYEEYYRKDETKLSETPTLIPTNLNHYSKSIHDLHLPYRDALINSIIPTHIINK